VIVLDTHVLVFDALDPKRLSRAALNAIRRGSTSGTLACSDISLWEIAMLVARGRISPNTDAVQLLDDIVRARSIRVLPISPRIAVLAQSDQFEHGDPADRIIAATALAHRAALVSADTRLRNLRAIKVIW
jgi:PIN domain nuclease of toxin-antitoxin system